MPILEHIPNQKSIRTSLRVIQDTAVILDDKDQGAVRALWDSAQAMWGLVWELETLRTKDLVEVYAYGRGHYRQMAPPPELAPLQDELTNPEYSVAKREELAKTIRALCADYAKGRQVFEDRLFDTVRDMRRKCLSLADSDLADRVIEVYSHKAEELQRELAWAQDSLKPLILDFQGQLANVDKSISDMASKNFFDHLLELMPSQSTINTLALPVQLGTSTPTGTTTVPKPKAAAPATPTTPAAPAAPATPAAGDVSGQAAPADPAQGETTAATEAQTEAPAAAEDQTPPAAAPERTAAEQTTAVVEATETTTPPPVATVEISTQTQAAATDATAAAPAAAAPAASSSTAPAAKAAAAPLPTAANLSSATPEAVALKAAYEVLQNGLKLFSTGTNLYKLVSKHEELRKLLDEVQAKYDEAMDRYDAIARELDNLERVRVVLNRVADYQCEIGGLEATLKAYTDAFAATRGTPEVYYELFRLLMDYLERLELVWR